MALKVFEMGIKIAGRNVKYFLDIPEQHLRSRQEIEHYSETYGIAEHIVLCDFVKHYSSPMRVNAPHM